MKKLLLVVLVIGFIILKSAGQSGYFEGRLIYRTIFKIKDSTERAVLFSKTYPSSTTKWFKKGNSLEIYDKGDSKSYLYLVAENKAYWNRWSQDTLYFFNCNEKGRNILDYIFSKNADTISGFVCDKLQIIYEGGSSSYYYNERVLRINPDWYKNLTYTNWNVISKILKSMALKTVIERDDYEITSIITDIKRQLVSDSYFRITPETVLLPDR